MFLFSGFAGRSISTKALSIVPDADIALGSSYNKLFVCFYASQQVSVTLMNLSSKDKRNMISCVIVRHTSVIFAWTRWYPNLFECFNDKFLWSGNSV